MRLLLSFAALLLSVALLQLSSGALSPLDVLSGLQEGFTRTQVGMLGSSHFLGFFIGCWQAPRLIGTIGHIRTFTIFASFGAIGAAAHPLFIDPMAWAGMRIMTGLCVAGCYTAIESWLQASLTNQTRGRVMGVYRVVDIVSASGAQLLIGVLEPASYVSYNLLAILCCLCLLPVTLTTSAQPSVPEPPRLRPLHMFRVSPLGAAGVIVAGITTASFRMVGPIYGKEVGLSQVELGYFLATVMLGGALAQFPAGLIADKYDRRRVLIGLSVLSLFICIGIAWANSTSPWLIYVGAALFGMATYPIFSVSAAHANDFAKAGEMVGVNASLIFLYGIGAIASPLLTSSLVDRFGAPALFVFIAIAHALLLAFSVVRMSARPTVADRTHYTYIPRTTYIIDKLLKRNNDNHSRDGSGEKTGH